MELNSKKLERTSRIVYYSISTILCIFLILLSNKIIDDLDSTVKRPKPSDYENKNELETYNREIEKQTDLLEGLYAKKDTIEKTILTAKDNYTNEKQSFDNWLQTRKTLGSPDKDQEVINRAKRLDDFYKVEQEWRTQLSSVQNQIDETEKKKQEFRESVDKIESVAYEKYKIEVKKYDLKVFLIRLLFVAPILAIGVFFFVRFRRHKFWPLYFGFTLFSLYAFFFGLVPYLPSYGGYIRYSVGVVLSAGIGYYAIKRIRQFISQKQSELKISTQERAKKVQTQVAEKALENHFCPSCGKDFLLRKWEFPISKNTDTEVGSYKFATTFCRHCGLELFKNCSNCGAKNFAHLSFCSSCGTKIGTKK